MITIGGKKIQVPEMTWLEFKQFLKVMGSKLFARREEIEEAMKSGGDVTSFMEALPDLVTEALSIALRLKPDEIEKATLTEILDVIPVVLEVNKVKENLEKAKKIKGLLPTPTQGPQMQDEASQAEKEIREKLKKRK